jgi:site-specific recombinase XerD
MQIKLTQFSNWLTCQYPHSSARNHTMSDLALFFSWAEKPPSAISPHDVDLYIQHCLSKGLSPLTINRRLSSLRLMVNGGKEYESSEFGDKSLTR